MPFERSRRDRLHCASPQPIAFPGTAHPQRSRGQLNAGRRARSVCPTQRSSTGEPLWCVKGKTGPGTAGLPSHFAPLRVDHDGSLCPPPGSFAQV
jgi:hypothetical protein